MYQNSQTNFKNLAPFAARLRIWSHLLKKYLTENFIFCVVISKICLTILGHYAVNLVLVVSCIIKPNKFCHFSSFRNLKHNPNEPGIFGTSLQLNCILSFDFCLC